MRIILAFIFLALLIGCEHSHKKETSFPYLGNFKEYEWTTYEGVIRLPSGELANVELSLTAGAPGQDAFYKFVQADHAIDSVISIRRYFQGSYSTLMGSNPSEFVIELHGARMNIITFTGHESEEQSREILRKYNETTRLFFITRGSEKLVMVDDDLRPFSDQQNHFLIKRSRPFTVEGYLTFENDSTSDFFEQNTREKWIVGNLGLYDQARDKYRKMAKEKFEGLYVKALAYSVNNDKDERHDELLVLKDIYEMRPGDPIE